MADVASPPNRARTRALRMVTPRARTPSPKIMRRAKERGQDADGSFRSRSRAGSRSFESFTVRKLRTIDRPLKRRRLSETVRDQRERPVGPQRAMAAAARASRATSGTRITIVRDLSTVIGLGRDLARETAGPAPPAHRLGEGPVRTGPPAFDRGEKCASAHAANAATLVPLSASATYPSGRTRYSASRASPALAIASCHANSCRATAAPRRPRRSRPPASRTRAPASQRPRAARSCRRPAAASSCTQGRRSPPLHRARRRPR